MTNKIQRILPVSRNRHRTREFVELRMPYLASRYLRFDQRRQRHNDQYK